MMAPFALSSVYFRPIPVVWRSTRLLAFLALLFHFSCLALRALVPGTVDPSFNADGTGPDGKVIKLLLQPDGKIFIAGAFTKFNGVPRPGLARLNSDGSLDGTFTPAKGGFTLSVNDPEIFLAQQPDGKLVVSGPLIRYNTDGTVDTSFNPSPDVIPAGVCALLPSGQMISCNPLIRLNSDGSSDPNFWPDLSPLNIFFTPPVNYPSGLFLRLFHGIPREGGKALLAIDDNVFYTGGGFTLRTIALLDPLGRVDTSFSPVGLGDVATATLGGLRDGIIPYTQGSILVAHDGQVARYPSSGKPDTNFVSIGHQARLIQCMAAQPDGKIVVGGALSSSNALAARLNSGGSLDPTFNSPPGFGTNGNIVSLSYDYIIRDLAIQADGKILVAGSFQALDGNPKPFLGRLIGDPPSPPSIWQQPLPQTALEQQTVTFSVEVGGINPTTFQWLFNGSPIPGATNVTLVLGKVQSAQAGAYSAVLHNPYGQTTSSTASLSIIPLVPPAITKAPQTIAAPAGSIVSFSVTATNFLPLHYQWAFQGAPITWGTNSMLVLTNIRPANAGIYSVAVSSEVISVTNSAPLYVLPPAIVDPGFDPGFGPEGSAAIFVDEFYGHGLAGPAVHSILPQQDGKVIVAGPFLKFGGLPRNRIARLNSDGTVDLTFDPRDGVSVTPPPSVPNPSPEIISLALQKDGKILIGGRFNAVNGIEHNGMARLNANGLVDTTFPASGVTVGPPSAFTPGLAFEFGFPYVTSFAIQSDGKIVIAGTFQMVNGLPLNGLARLNADGSVDTAFNPGEGLLPPPNSSRTSTIVGQTAIEADGSILVQGTFQRAYETNIIRLGLARFRQDGSLDLAFDPVKPGDDLGSGTYAISPYPNGDILLSGFYMTNGAYSTGLRRLKHDGSADPTFHPPTGLNLPITAALQPDGKIVVAGSFTNIGGAPRIGMARLLPDGSLDMTFNPGQGPDNGTSSVRVSALSPVGEIIVAGSFRHFDTALRNGLATLSPVEPIGLSLSVLPPMAGIIHFSYPTIAGKSYTVETRTSLTLPWQPLQSTAGEGSRKEVSQSITNAFRLYRVRAE